MSGKEYKAVEQIWGSIALLLYDAICVSYLAVIRVNVQFDMLTGGASVLGWLATRHAD